MRGVKVAWLDQKLSAIFGETGKRTMNWMLEKTESGETAVLHYVLNLSV